MAGVQGTMADPRLVALGLAQEPPPTPLAAEPVPAEPVTVLAAVMRVPAAVPAPRVEVEPLAPSEVLLSTEVIVGRRRAELSLERLGLRLGGASPLAVRWVDVTAIDARGHRVRIRTRDVDLDVTVALDGVAEPHLGAPFAGVVREVAGGRFEREGTAAVQLQNATDQLRERFREADDETIALAAGAAGVGVVFVAMLALPTILFLAMRPSVAPDAFILAARLSWWDPRLIAVAIAAGALAASLVVRITLGPSARHWTRGTLRGWRADTSGVVRRVRRGLALAVAYPTVSAAILVAGFLASLPSARDQATVDPAGVQVFGPLPMLDRTMRWNEVAEVTKVPAPAHAEGFAVAIRTNDGRVVSTGVLRLQNGTDAYFYDLISRWRAAPGR